MSKIIKRKMKVISNQFCETLKSIFYQHKKIANPCLLMTLLVKDEEDVIEDNLRFHKSMGVDAFIVTDNHSTDRTNEILNHYQKIGWIKEIINEPSEAYSQEKWVDRMIKLAADRYQADWIINADADELWFSKSGNLKTELQKSTANVLKCKMFNMLPNDSGKFLDSEWIIKKPVEQIEEFNLSKFSMYTKQIPKSMHRAKGYKKIFTGNHKVIMRFQNAQDSQDIMIYHYSIRNRNHFKSKMINGGKAFEKNLELGKDVGRHWRYFYEGWKSGTLDLDIEYDKSIGSEYFTQFIEMGIIENNDSVKNYFAGLKK